MAATFRKHTVRARRNALQGVHSGVVPPMLRTAEAMALTEHDAQSAIDMVGSSGWDAPTRTRGNGLLAVSNACCSNGSTVSTCNKL
jgi:hypothetical protein